MLAVGPMKTARIGSAIGAALLLASRAAAHGPVQGALHPHAHPHAEASFGGWGIALIAAAVVGGVALLVRAIAKRR